MRLLLIEDSQPLRLYLQRGLTAEGMTVDVAADGIEGLSLALRGSYDVVVLDLLLPRLSGLKVLRHMIAGGSTARVLVLTAQGQVEDRVRCLQAGADDYLVKPCAFEELLARIEALARDRPPRSASTLQLGSLEIDTQRQCVRRSDRCVDLTGREYRILELLAQRRGETVSRMEIEDHVYADDRLPKSNAIDSAVCTLRRKLATVDASRLVRTRYGVGYSLDPDGAV